jgi:excisionase family DNA binding protein
LNNDHVTCPSPQDSLNYIAPSPFNTHAPGVCSKQLLTDIEVAEYLGISVATVRRWRLRGGGPRWIRIGSSIRYQSADLHVYIVGLPSGGGAETTRIN